MIRLRNIVSLLIFLPSIFTQTAERFFQISLKLYEFHPQKVIFARAFLLNEKNSFYQVLIRHPEDLEDPNKICYKVHSYNDSGKIQEERRFSPYSLTLPDLYDTKDLLNIAYSSNIGNYITEWDTTHWRNESYYSLRIEWLPKSLNSDTFFWVKGTTKRLPHLHTTDCVSSGRQFDLGVNAVYDYRANFSYQAFAFPKNTKIIETSGFIPDLRFSYNDWLILLYKLPEGRRVSAHVKFVLPKTDVADIDLEHFLNRTLIEIRNMNNQSK